MRAGRKGEKREGRGVTARNMSKDVRKKTFNALATPATGLGVRYARMNAANLNAPIPARPKPGQSGSCTKELLPFPSIAWLPEDNNEDWEMYYVGM